LSSGEKGEKKGDRFPFQEYRVESISQQKNKGGGGKEKKGPDLSPGDTSTITSLDRGGKEPGCNFRRNVTYSDEGGKRKKKGSSPSPFLTPPPLPKKREKRGAPFQAP